MAGEVRWYGEQVRAAITAEIKRRLRACAITVNSYAKQLINVEGAGKPSGKGKRLRYNANPSAPGEPPHKQTGRLLGSVAWELVETGGKWVARVGTNIRYGRWLELGTKLMAARPWLRRALAEKSGAVKAILERPMGPK